MDEDPTLSQQLNRPASQHYILCSTGSFAPIHKCHLQMFIEAKDHLSSQDPAALVTGILSPSHDMYVWTKLGPSKFIHSDHRIRMCELLVKEHDWIFVTDYETSPPSFPDLFCRAIRLDNTAYTHKYLKVVNHSATKQMQPDHPPFSIFFLCGTDTLLSHFGEENLDDIPYGVIAVERPGFPTPHFDNPNIQIIKNSNVDVSPFSSTLVRDLWCEGKPIEEFTSKEIQGYMKAHDLVKKPLF